MTLAVDGVAVSFGGNHVLRDLSLSAHAGSVTALIGPNGAGKTTLFNVVAGVLRPDTGRVLLDDEDLSRKGVHARARAGIGRTFQRLELFGTLSVRENLEVAAGARAPRVPGRVARSGVPSRRLARARAVDAIIERLDLGAIASLRADTLPTGTARTVELARALVASPNVLLLDEPASGQTAQETDAFAGVIRELADQGCCVVLVEHDMALVMASATLVYVLDGGRLIASGPPKTVRADPAVQAAYLGKALESGGEPAT